MRSPVVRFENRFGVANSGAYRQTRRREHCIGTVRGCSVLLRSLTMLIVVMQKQYA